jgi:arylsulfatase A-like enzyme
MRGRPGRGLRRLAIAGVCALVALATAVAAVIAWRPERVDGYDAEGRPMAGGRVVTGRLLPERPKNLILVSVDTLRADAVGFGGRSRPVSPYLDRLARRGVVFAECISSAPHTDPAHATLFTGLYPRSHGVYDHTRRLTPETATMAEILGSQGYRTAAITNSPKFHRSIGLDQGFAHYEIVAPYETGPWLERVLSFLDALPERPEQPLFLFLHVLDPHAPYNPDGPLRDAFHEPYSGPFTGHLGNLKRRDGGGTGAAYALIELVRAWYDSEVLEADAALGTVFTRLEELGLLEDGVLVVVSDHGEEFLDHGGMEHSHTLYDELIKVPLVVRAPGWPEGRVVDAQVRTVDVLPTVLSLLGLPAAGPGPGVPLSPYLREETGPAVSERGPEGELAWRTRGQKVLYGLHSGQISAYYDLVRDPAERSSRVRHAFEQAGRLEAEVQSWIAGTAPSSAAESVLDAATREAIEALGYVGD